VVTVSSLEQEKKNENPSGISKKTNFGIWVLRDVTTIIYISYKTMGNGKLTPSALLPVRQFP
jgi:hypothetical protein